MRGSRCGHSVCSLEKLLVASSVLLLWCNQPSQANTAAVPEIRIGLAKADITPHQLVHMNSMGAETSGAYMTRFICGFCYWTAAA
jgi:hypothetical protein